MSTKRSSNPFDPLDDSPSPSPKVWSHRIKAPIVASSLSPDIIHVGHRLALTDTHSITPVKRDLPISDLSKLPAAKSLQENIGGKIVVSPEKPATEDTEVRVETTIEEILRRMKREMWIEIDAAVEKRVNSLRADLHENLCWLSKAHGVRNIEDWALQRMRNMLGISDKDKVEHATVVDRFMESFTYGGVTKSDLEHLKHSSARDEANAVIHVRYGNESREEMLKVWRFLKPSLEGKDRLRYERLWKFGLGETAVLKK